MKLICNCSSHNPGCPVHGDARQQTAALERCRYLLALALRLRDTGGDGSDWAAWAQAANTALAAARGEVEWLRAHPSWDF